MNRPVLSPRWPAGRREHQVIVERETFGAGFDVRVLPAPETVGHDQEFRSYRGARQYAEQLASRMGWRLIDHAGDGHAAA